MTPGRSINLITGPAGATGNGISTIVRTSGTGLAGTTDTYTITFTDATTTTYTVVNGANGATGAPGATGPVGPNNISLATTSSLVGVFAGDGTSVTVVASTGTGSVMRSASPTTTGTLTAAAITASGTVTAGAAISGGLGRVQITDNNNAGGLSISGSTNPGTSFYSGGILRGFMPALVTANGSYFGDALVNDFLIRSDTPGSRVLIGVGGTNSTLQISLTALSVTGNLTASGIINFGVYTVGTLPSASANPRAKAYVSDSNLAYNSSNLGSTVTAGGAILVPVWSNGTNWIIG